MEAQQQDPRDKGYETIEALEYGLQFLWNGGHEIAVLHREEGETTYNLQDSLCVADHVDLQGERPTREEAYSAIWMELSYLEELTHGCWKPGKTDDSTEA